MSIVFNPSGQLNLSWDASDLPGVASEFGESSGAMTRCKNLRVNQQGIAKTRDGSAKINTSAIDTAIWWIEVMNGVRYTFAGDEIYEDESSLASGLTEAQWSAIQYNAYNDTTLQIFALNGTDRKRITSGAVNEWGIAAPTVAPTLEVGSGSGLTGLYNAQYTYVRKVGSSIVAESDPSPAADFGINLSDQSLAVTVTASSDSQVTHYRLYRTLANGSLYYLDLEADASTTYAYGYAESFESDDTYIAGDGYKFTIEDDTHGTENTYTWEEVAESTSASDSGTSYGGSFTPYSSGSRQSDGTWDYEP